MLNNITLNSHVIGTTQQINEHMLHYVESEGKIPVLLVHGLGFSLYSMRNVYNDLTGRGYKVIAVDLPGCGYSTAMQSVKMSPDEIAMTLHALIEALNVDKVHIYAIAEGAIYAMRLAQIYPQDVASLMLVSPGSLTKHYPIKFRNLATPIIGELLAKIMKRKHINDFLQWILFDETSISPTLGRQTYQPFTNKETKLGLLNLLRDYQDISVFANLSKIFCPVNVIWGEYDVGHPINMSDLFIKKIENCGEFIIPNSAHLVHEERPKMVCNIIDQLIRGYNEIVDY